MRHLRILCVVAVICVAGVALGNALKEPASHAQAQNQMQIQVNTGMSGAPAASPRSSAPAASNGAAPTVVAANIGIRSLAIEPQSSGVTAASSNAANSTHLFLTAIDQPDRVFSFALPSIANIAPASIGKLLTTPAAGIGSVGSIGDGGAATSAELDLNLEQITMRSGVVSAPDGTLYIADTGNATIRMIAGPSSSEPGIIRSVAGRWAPRQNVELGEPMGIAMDRAGNVYIADHGASAIVMLHGTASPKAGQLETLAHMASPATIAVTLDGSTVFAASPDTGAVAAINTQTRAVRSVAVSPAVLFAGAAQGSTSARIVPMGLAVDGGGNLFIAYTDPGGSYDQILRLDAFSSKLTVAARGLSAPGDISFDAAGNLFVANQGTRQILKFKTMGVPTNGVTLTPPANCAAATTTFCDQLIGGTSASAAFELTNNTSSAISGLTATFLNGNTADFSVANSSCGTSLAANASCAYNVVFAPTANATTACGVGAATNSRCATLSVNYAGATAALTTPVSGTADDFQIQCMSTMAFTCPPPTNDAPYQITIAQGFPATFQLQIVPDSNFSGPVTVNCPLNLPEALGGNPTTCGISSGNTVTLPLVQTLTLNVVAGTALPFNVTFQTTTTKGTQFPAPTTKGAKLSAALASFFSGGNGGGDANGSRHAGIVAAIAWPVTQYLVKTTVPRDLPTIFLMGLAFAAIILLSLPSIRRPSSPRLIALCALGVLLLAVTASMGGCGKGYSGSSSMIPYTPTGTYPLTVQGSAQNGSRGFTVTLVVD